MDFPISVGVIGCGYAAEVHLPAIRSIKNARLTAVADSDPARLEAIANRYGVEHRHLDWREIIQDRTIQAVAVLTPPRLHLEMTLEAVRSGKHVLIEKPLVADLDEADRLIEETASSSQAKIIIGYNLRFHRQIRQLRAMIRDGMLGKIEFVRGVATTPYVLRKLFPDYRKSRDQGGGVVIEVGVHYYDLWEHLLDERVRCVSTLSQSGEGDDMTAIVSGRMDSGILVATEFSAQATAQHEIEVYGDRARAKASLYRFDGLRVFSHGSHEGGIGHRLRDFCETALNLPTAFRAISAGGVFLESFRNQWRYFLDCIHDDTPAHPGPLESRRSLAVALSAVRAADTDKLIRIDDNGTSR